MSKRAFKAQASSSRAAQGAFGTFGSSFGTQSLNSTGPVSVLSYLAEPPTLTEISSPNIAVALKNLSKKDSTTKVKALEELQHALDESDAVEEPIVEAWASLYPRLSIDAARRVRQLSHNVHGQICCSAGKRIAKYMPVVIGPWLAGLYDNDKLVARDAQLAFSNVFATKDKVHALRKVYQPQILDFIRGVLVDESPKTLSDERNISADEALGKYNRVVSAAVGLFSSCFTIIEREERKKLHSTYVEMLENEIVWKFAVYADGAVRRAMHRFLKVFLASATEVSTRTADILSTTYVDKGLESDQAMSASGYVDALLSLTKTDVTVWTTRYAGRRAVESHLRHFVKRGTQGAAGVYWSAVATLFASIPSEALPQQEKEVEELMRALQTGFKRKEEPRGFEVTGFKAYFQILGSFIPLYPDDQKEILLQNTIIPIIREYIDPISDASKNSLPASNAQGLLLDSLLVPGTAKLATSELSAIVTLFTDDLKRSLPEQSKDHARTQDLLSERGKRLTTLLSMLRKVSKTEDSLKKVREASNNIIQACVDVVTTRNGKPYAATETIASLLGEADLLAEDASVWVELDRMIQSDALSLLASPSSAATVRILTSGARRPAFQSANLKAIESLSQPEGLASGKATDMLTQLLVIPLPEHSLQQVQNQVAQFASGLTRQALSSSDPEIASRAWNSTALLVRTDGLEDDNVDKILAPAVQSLSLETAGHGIESALKGLQQIAVKAPRAFDKFLASPSGRETLPRVLLLTEASDSEVARLASDFGDMLYSKSISQGSTASNGTNLDVIIKSGLETASSTSVSIQTLVELSIKLSSTISIFPSLLPNLRVWASELTYFASLRPPTSLSVIHPLAGALHLIDGPEQGTEVQKSIIARDSQGLSVPIRMATYVIQLLKQKRAHMHDLPGGQRQELFGLLLETQQLANDNLTIAKSNGIWLDHSISTEPEMIDYLADSQIVIAEILNGAIAWWDNSNASDSAYVRDVLKAEFSQATFRNTESYCSAQVYCSNVAELISIHGPNSKWTAGLDDRIKSMRRSNSLFQSLAFITAYKSVLASVPSAQRLCNEAIADLTGMGGSRNTDKIPQQLVMLNAFLQNVEDITACIAKQRLIFFVKAAIDLLKSDQLARIWQAEICKALGVLMPLMKDMYGDYWADILNYIVDELRFEPEADDKARQGSIPALHAALRLLNVIQRLSEEPEANEDIVEAWSEASPRLTSAVLALLQSPIGSSDSGHQPLRMVNDLLARRVKSIPAKSITGVEDMYSVLTTQSAPLQEAAYTVLHRFIPSQQDQVSFDAALENKVARLPNELLSLIIDPPGNEAADVETLEDGIPLSLRAYCLSWLLVFDHFENSSYKVKVDYLDHLKEGEYTSSLLDYIFDVLGHSGGKPVDASNFDVTRYAVGELDPPLRDFQWLLIHLYYQCLAHIPSLAKAWWMDCKSRQKTIAVESWTEKYISPHITSVALSGVRAWSSEQATASTADDMKPLTVKISPRSSELTASYPVDESSCAIRVTLPPTFPLHQARVESISRVAIDERHWQSWLRITQGVIAFSNNNIVDGLTNWRRNIVGALKGQTECAICYSIVAEDGTLPKKKCRTCKNSFHGGCLFKWFRTSGGATCPLCRSSFNYG